jgi:nitrate reductase assembly molybdenum cofactor insertion protein NarJ
VSASPAPVEIAPRVRDLLREALEWRLIGLLLERPRGRWWAEVATLANDCPDADLQEAARAAVRAAEGPYLAALGPGGAVSPREAGHRETADPGHLLSEIAAFYRAFAYEPATEEPPDHVSVGAGFVGYLRLKQAYAAARGDAEAAEVTAEAARRFLASHLATCAEPIAEGLAAAGVPHLALASRALLRRTGPRPADIEGGWAPRGLCAEGCPMAGDDERA